MSREMTNEELKKRLEHRIKMAKMAIATKEASIKRAELDLADLASADARLKKQREVKLRKAGAPRKDDEDISTFKGKPALDQKIEIPTMEMDLPAPPAPAPEKKEKSKLTFW